MRTRPDRLRAPCSPFVPKHVGIGDPQKPQNHPFGLLCSFRHERCTGWLLCIRDAIQCEWEACDTTVPEHANMERER